MFSLRRRGHWWTISTRISWTRPAFRPQLVASKSDEKALRSILSRSRVHGASCHSKERTQVRDRSEHGRLPAALSHFRRRHPLPSRSRTVKSPRERVLSDEAAPGRRRRIVDDQVLNGIRVTGRACGADAQRIPFQTQNGRTDPVAGEFSSTGDGDCEGDGVWRKEPAIFAEMRMNRKSDPDRSRGSAAFAKVTACQRDRSAVSPAARPDRLCESFLPRARLHRHRPFLRALARRLSISLAFFPPCRDRA